MSATTTIEPQTEMPERRRRKRWLLLLLLLLLLLSVCCWGFYLLKPQPIVKILPPAPVIAEALKPHYLYSIYGMQEPVGVAVTPDGERIYVAESAGERLIRVFDPKGKQLAAFAPPDSQPPLRAPVYIALDSAGLVYVTDRARHSVDLYDAGGNYKRSLKMPTPEEYSPLGIRFSGNTLLLTDVTEGKHRVLLMKPDGTLIKQFGKEGKSADNDELWFPNSALPDANGNIFVSDSNGGRLKVFDKSGKLQYVIPDLSLPRGLALDADRRLYVVDGVDHKVKVFDASQSPSPLLFEFGDLGMGNGEFQYPNDIAIDDAGRLYVADRVNNRVQVWVY